MSKQRLYINLIIANFKRLKKYLPSLFAAMILLLSLLCLAAHFLSNNIYKTKKYETVQLAYFLDADEDERYISFAIDYLNSMKSMKETANIIQVNSVEEGYAMVESGEVLFFIYLPSGFYEGIMTGHNPTVNIVVRDNKSMATYISNELFLSLARYLSTAQAAIYSAIDTSWAHEMDDNEVARVNQASNMIFFEKVADKDSAIKVIEATSENNHSLKNHYEAAAIMLCLFFMAFILIPFMQGCNKGIAHKFKICKITNIHIFSSNLYCVFTALYLIFIPCHLVISVMNQSINSKGLIGVLPALLGIALIITLIGSLSKSAFSGNLILLFTVIAIAYIGGAIIPNAMLPRIIQNLTTYMPGKYLLANIANSLF